MIRKILQVRDLGRLRALAWDPSLGELGRSVGVCGDNGVGKTTLVTALRAAGERSVAPLLERRTLGERAEPIVELLLSDGVLHGTSLGWVGPDAAIRVFDRAFVDAHVHHGPVVGPDQRHALYRLALGAGEVDAARRVDDARANQAARNRELADLEKRLDERAAAHELTVGELVELEPLEAATPELYQARDRLNALEQRPDLRGLPGFAPLPALLRAIDRQGVAVLLDRSVQALHTATSERVAAHLASLGPTGEAWVRDGLSLAGADCPFCARALGGAELPELYRAYFDDEYHDLLAVLDRAMGRLSAWEAWIEQTRAVATRNDEARAAWEKYAPLDPRPEVEPLLAAATAMVRALRALLEQKRDHPLAALGSDPRVDAVAEAAGSLPEVHRVYQEWAATQRERCARIDSAEEQEKLREVVALARARLDRHKVAADVEARTQAQLDARQAKAAFAEAQAELDRRQSARTAAFTDQINQVLSDFGARFSVTGLEGKESASRVTADFGLALDGGSIKASTQRANAPRFATVLSEGDKTALAFAVFVARCRSEPDPSRILVFDDPLTSLDSGRRAVIRRTIGELARDSAQIWVFSYDGDFVRDACGSDGATLLRLEPTATGAALVPWVPVA